MEETIDPGTGLPVGAQPTPVGAYDFSKSFESVQGMLDKIAQGQANRAAEMQKNKKEWEDLQIEDPSVWREDDPYVQLALKDYDDYRVKLGKDKGYDVDKYDDDEKKELRRLESEVSRRANEAKANENYLKEVRERINADGGKTLDTGWGTEWINKFADPNTTTEERNRMRKSAEEDDNPYHKMYSLDDVVQKYQVYDTKKDGSRDVDVKEIYNRVLAGAKTKGGVGRRMYIVNRLSPQETEEEYAKRVADLSPSMLGEIEARTRQGRKSGTGNEFGVTTESGFLKDDENAAQDVRVNAMYLTKKGSPVTVTVGSGKLQWTYKISYITRSHDGKGGWDYWIHGERNGVPLSKPQKMDSQDLGAINTATKLDIIADFERDELEGAKFRWKDNLNKSNLPGGISVGEPDTQDIINK